MLGNVQGMARQSLLRARMVAQGVRSATRSATGGARSPLAIYADLLVRRPMPTKMVTSGLLFGVGDTIAQKLGAPEKPFDFDRTKRAMLFGFTFNGIVGHLHYNFLDWLVTKRMAVSIAKTPYAKVFIEQFVYWSWVSNGAYLYGMARLEGETHATGVTTVTSRIMDLQYGQWALWIPVQWVNFKFIPVPWQLNFVLCFQIVWTTYLSLFNRAREGLPQEENKCLSGDSEDQETPLVPPPLTTTPAPSAPQRTSADVDMLLYTANPKVVTSFITNRGQPIS